MHLSPKEIEKLMLHQAGALAQKRYARGVLLNHPETVALIATQVLEFIRDGLTVAEIMTKGKLLIGIHEVMPGIETLVDEVQVEGTFPDGTKLVTIHQPICNGWGNEEFALYGSQLKRLKMPPKRKEEITLGETTIKKGSLELNEGRETTSITVMNTGDRPVQVGSHYPFFEVNAALDFDRAKAYGYRLNIPSGTAVRFEPGEEKSVELVALAGLRVQHGGSGLTDGPIDAQREIALSAAHSAGFKGA
ncbi:MAG: urease subunit beta [Fibrobacterales bacterium]